MIDRLREQIQQRLDLTHEADRLRKALAALDPRSSVSASAQACRAQATQPHGEAEGVRDEECTGPANEPVGGRLSSPDGAGGDQGLGARRARRWRGDDRRRGGEKTGLARATVSTTLSKLAKSGEVQKAERGYRIASAAGE